MTAFDPRRDRFIHCWRTHLHLHPYTQGRAIYGVDLTIVDTASGEELPWDGKVGAVCATWRFGVVWM